MLATLPVKAESAIDTYSDGVGCDEEHGTVVRTEDWELGSSELLALSATEFLVEHGLLSGSISRFAKWGR